MFFTRNKKRCKQLITIQEMNKFINENKLHIEEVTVGDNPDYVLFMIIIEQQKIINNIKKGEL